MRPSGNGSRSGRGRTWNGSPGTSCVTTPGPVRPTASSSASLGLSVCADQEHVGRVDAHEVNRLRAALGLFVADVFASV
ncbi:hypothetical protein EHS43_22015, partial [Streptomyces sp. RP5T]